VLVPVGVPCVLILVNVLCVRSSGTMCPKFWYCEFARCPDIVGNTVIVLDVLILVGVPSFLVLVDIPGVLILVF
jgi:hypothetical protein